LGKITLPGWRKDKDLRRQLKDLQLATSQVVYRGGPNKDLRVKKAVLGYLDVGRALWGKVQETPLAACDLPMDAARWERLQYFHAMLDKHLDLVSRRLFNEERMGLPACSEAPRQALLPWVEAWSEHALARQRFDQIRPGLIPICDACRYFSD